MEKYLGIAMTVLLFVFGLTNCDKAAEEEQLPPQQIDEPRNEQVTVSVKFTEEMAALVSSELEAGRLQTRSSALNEFVERSGAVSFERIFPDGGQYEERHRRAGLHLWFRVKFGTDRITATRAAAELEDIQGVELAEPEPRAALFAADDTQYSSQWYLYQTTGIDINVNEVWAHYTTGSPEVLVAVIDSGIELTHPDLSANTLPGGNGKSMNFVNNSYNIQAGDHGTHVAGVIGATRNNGEGIAGIAGGDASKGQPGVRMMSCVVFGKDSEGKDISGNFEAAIVYAADNGANICQNSWGYVMDLDNNGTISADELEYARSFTLPSSMKTAIDYFVESAGCDNDGNQLPDSPMKGGIVTFSAGNDNIPYGWPSMYENVLAVGSITASGYKSDFSNYGDWVDICAPGTNIMSCIPGGYGFMSGTSMACPMVSGIAALVLSYHGGYGYTNEDLKAALLGGASYDKISSTQIGPLANALESVAYGTSSAPGPVENFSTEVKANNVTIRWTVPDRGNGLLGAYAAAVYYSTDRNVIENLDPRHPSSAAKSLITITSDMAIGAEAECTVRNLSFEKEYFFRLASFNPGGSYAPVSEMAAITTLPNNPPEISCDTPLENLRIAASQMAGLTFSIYEPDGHDFTYEYVPGSPAETFFYSGNQCKVNISGNKAEAGIYTARLTATDSYKASSTLEIRYEILDNRSPEVAKEMDNMLLFIGDGTTERPLDGYFTDPDEDVLMYSASLSEPSIAVATADSDKLYVTPKKAGVCKLSITANDPRKASATQDITLVVREKGTTLSIYPTQVSSMLYIAAGAESIEVKVSITAAGSGATIYSETLRSSAFEPAAVNMDKVAPGRYHVEVTAGGDRTVRTIVKL